MKVIFGRELEKIMFILKLLAKALTRPKVCQYDGLRKGNIV